MFTKETNQLILCQWWYSEHMGVSLNGDTPKSSILIGFSIINHPFWGTAIFGNTHILNLSLPFLYLMEKMPAVLWRCLLLVLVDYPRLKSWQWALLICDQLSILWQSKWKLMNTYNLWQITYVKKQWNHNSTQLKTHDFLVMPRFTPSTKGSDFFWGLPGGRTFTHEHQGWGGGAVGGLEHMFPTWKPKQPNF